MNTDPVIGERLFTDDIVRPVFWDGERQYVFDADAQQVYGVWIYPAEEPESPIIIERLARA